jgi:hypothetical protein
LPPGQFGKAVVEREASGLGHGVTLGGRMVA